MTIRWIRTSLAKDRGVTWLGEQRLLFYSDRNGGYEIWSVRKDGSDLKRITESTGLSLWMPRTSPDGTRLMTHNAEGTYVFEFPSDTLLSKDQALHVANVDGADGALRGDGWTPTGDRIVGTVWEPLGTTVAVHDLRDGSSRVFRAPDGADSISGSWLPDGRRFLATAGGRAWIVDTGTETWTELPLRVGTRGVKLTPDGRTLQYVDSVSEADIWVARIE